VTTIVFRILPACLVLGPAAAAAQDLAEVCPDPVVFQTDWFPQTENAMPYHLIGPDGTVGPDRGTYTGPIGDTGVSMELRLGGPFVGYQTVTSLMYQDPDILLGLVSTDEAIILSGEFPTVAIMAPLEKSPQVVMYAEDDFPDLSGWEAVRDTGATILYFEGSSFMTYLIGKGLVDPGQVDGSYDGSPSRFAVEDGIMQSGYATNDVFRYETVIEEVGEPMDYLLVHDAGYTVYTSAVAVRPPVLEERADCLAALVPLMQRAQADYMADPAATNDTLLAVNDALTNPWVITEAVNDYGHATMAELGIVSEGPDEVIGNFDMERIAAFLDEARPIFESAGIRTMADDLAAEDLATNRFIDPSVGLD